MSLERPTNLKQLPNMKYEQTKMVLKDDGLPKGMYKSQSAADIRGTGKGD